MLRNTEVTSEEVIKVLKAAKRRIQTRGWRQNAYTYYDGSVCILGALGWAEDVVVCLRDHLTADLVAVCVDARLAVSGDYLLSHWNDAPERTKTDVLKAFDAAITLAGI